MLPAAGRAPRQGEVAPPLPLPQQHRPVVGGVQEQPQEVDLASLRAMVASQMQTYKELLSLLRKETMSNSGRQTLYPLMV